MEIISLVINGFTAIMLFFFGFILNDLRDRIERIENIFIEGGNHGKKEKK